MSPQYEPIRSMRLADDLWDRLAHAAHEQKVTRSDIVRAACLLALDSPDFLRTLAKR